MSCPTFESEVSKALAKSDIDNTDIFLVLDNGTTYKVTIADLIAALGTTGAITSVSPPGAVPVLSGVSPNYEVRGIVGGAGISAVLNGSNAVQVSSRVANAGAAIDGVPLIVNANATTTAWRRIKGDGVVSVAQNANSITISIPSGSELLGLDKFQFVQSKEDLPAAVAGVITLEAGKAYLFIGDVDLAGDRLALSATTAILGSSSETSSLTSTGLGTDYLITTSSTMPIQNITIKNVTNAISVNPSNVASGIALDWRSVNFSGCTINGRFGNIANFIMDNAAIIGKGKFEFFGTADTVAINNSLLSGDGTAYSMIDIQSTATITRRFRVIYSSFIATASTVAINVDVGATIPSESYILNVCNFAGGGTYLTGVLATDNKALFLKNVGIINSRDISQYFMNGNATETVIAVVSTPVKILGATTSAAVTSKFTNTDNRATYNGALNGYFKVSATLSLESANNNQIGIYIAKNGVILPESETYITTGGTGKGENAFVQTLVTLNENDFIEIFVENNTGTTNITVSDLNVVIQ